MIASLLRLYARITKRYPSAPTRLPCWLTKDRLTDVVGSEVEVGGGCSSNIEEEARVLVRELSSLELLVLADLDRITGKKRGDAERPMYAASENSVDSASNTVLPSVALSRLLLGACCEAFAALACYRITPPGKRAEGKQPLARAQQLYVDSCKASVWTSVHVRYLGDLVTANLAVAVPSVHLVPSELTELDFSEIYSKRVSAKLCNFAETTHLLSLLSRCTNPGSRGWDSIVKHSLEKSEGTRRIMLNAVLVSLTGMHSFVHPALRLHWKQRAVLIETLNTKLVTSSLCEQMTQSVAHFKEIVRRMLVNCVSTNYAMVSALQRVEHPLALLRASPAEMVNEGLESSCASFVASGKRYLAEEGNLSVTECLKRGAKTRTTNDLDWNSKFLGKGTASIHQKVPAVSVAADVWQSAFRCAFIPFWAHSNSHRLRASRLDKVQYAAIHGLNAATNLTMLLTEKEQMGLNRTAFAHPSSGIMTIEEVASLLGIVGMRGSSCNGGSKGTMDAVDTLGCCGGKNAARMLTFCRAAWIAEEMLIYDLGERTRSMQARALVKRLLVDELYPEHAGKDPLDLMHLVPMHSKTLCACIQCKRVANAHANDGGSKWRQRFNELGTNGAMVSVDHETRELQLRCAKRSSASLRAAVAFEEDMAVRRVESLKIDEAAVVSMISDATSSSDNGISARVRRDAKNAMEQRVSSVPCGCERMLNIDLLGRVVRLYNEWYAILPIRIHFLFDSTSVQKRPLCVCAESI